ncbi:MAG TPA: hypothetical protein DE312_05020 [Gallionella sp.]|nr:MAG: hypothetical protein A2Z87_07825 [Gallionellales bacterium GWA2_54_124]OGT20400.1 MAG: hypothetical protein A2522_09205 [Gallionellales bacterium RIFOXYD12_FULL_53_10]HCI52667.1 hypothetical protein [Gallionella sp.]
MKSVFHRFTRQQLYDLVWESPITSVAKELGVSDVAVAKACRKAEIPIPPRGYWAKLHAGKQVIRGQLGYRGLGKSDEISIGNYYFASPRDWDADLPPPPSYSESPAEVFERARVMVKGVSFPKTLSNPHREIDAVLKEDEARRAELLKTPYYWKKPVFDTPEDKRRLKILNAIFTVMTKVGEKPFLNCRDQISAGVIVGEMRIAIEFETLHQKKRPIPPEKLPKTKPQLKLTITHYGSDPEFQTCWADSNESQLEEHIEQISANLLIAGEMNYRSQVQHSYDWMVERKAEHEKKKREEQERRERERLEQIRKLKKQRRRQLLVDVMSWRRADEIRSFVAAVKARPDLKSCTEAIEKLDHWAAWALAEADQMDPMKREISKLTDWCFPVF